MNTHKIGGVTLATLLAFSTSLGLSAASTSQDEIEAISREHDASYQIEEQEARAEVLESLLNRAIDLHKQNPENALASAWIGWLKLDSAFLQTNPQLAVARFQDARRDLEAAVAIDPNCCGAGVYSAIGVIAQFPVSASAPTDEAKQFFEKALALDPKGLIVNTRYGGYLMRLGDLDGALKRIEVALAAPALPNRPGEDRVVRARAQVILDQIRERKGKQGSGR